MDATKITEFECAVDARSNTEVESAVIRGVAVALLDGTEEGIKAMMDEDVPNEIIFRVLSGESRRRSSDWKLCSSYDSIIS